MSVSLSRIDGHALLERDSRMLRAGPFEGEADRVDRELVEELEQLVGDEIDRLDQEVPAAHRRVEHLEVEEPLDQVLVGGVGLLDGESLDRLLVLRRRQPCGG